MQHSTSRKVVKLNSKDSFKMPCKEDGTEQLLGHTRAWDPLGPEAWGILQGSWAGPGTRAHPTPNQKQGSRGHGAAPAPQPSAPRDQDWFRLGQAMGLQVGPAEPGRCLSKARQCGAAAMPYCELGSWAGGQVGETGKTIICHTQKLLWEATYWVVQTHGRKVNYQ